MSDMNAPDTEALEQSRRSHFDRFFSDFSAYLAPVIVVFVAMASLVYWGRASYFTSNMAQVVPLLEAGVLTLSMGLLLVSVASRKWLYVLFAGWLVGNLRLTALSMGWDTQWLGQAVPASLVPLMRSLTIALYYILTYALFTQLFKTELSQVGAPRLQTAGRLSGVVMLAAALGLPFEQFLPLMWMLVTLAACLVVYLMALAIEQKRHSVDALWYGLALIVVIAIGSGAVGAVARALDFTTFDETVLHIGSALLSSVLIALVIANTERKERQQRIHAQEELKRVYQAAPIGLFSLSRQGQLTRANPAMKDLLGISSLEGERAHWENHFGPEGLSRLLKALEAGGPAELELQAALQYPEQKQQIYLIKAVLENGQIEGSLQDISAHLDVLSRLGVESNIDQLTGALNPQAIDAELQASIARMAQGETMVLGYLELTSLKTVNKLYGKAAGDDVLRQICERIKEILGIEGSLGRLTGSEFLVFFANMALEKARELAQRIIDDLLLRPIMIGAMPFKFQCAFGVVELTPSAIEPGDALVVAKRAAREARKQQGAQVVAQQLNGHELAEQSLDLRLLREFTSEFSTEGLSLVMQPIMSLSDPFGSLNFEVLLRKHDRKGTLVNTGKLIAAAEESGVVTQIDEWVVTTALEWLDANQSSFNNTQFVCINLNGMSLNDPQFIETFYKTFQRFPSVARKLLIEITETVALQDTDMTREFIERVQAMGARVALDDFGAGYTSFAYLKKLPTNALKIDGAFTRTLAEHPADVAILQAIVALARSLNMFIIAEWAEDVPTLRILKDLGVDYVQGYVISRPQSPELICKARHSASFIDDHKTRQFVAYYVQPGNQDNSRTL